MGFCVLFLLWGRSGVLSAQEVADVRPVFFSDEDLRRAESRVRRHSWAMKAWEDIRRSADRWLALPSPLPEGSPGLYHDYFCPGHGAPLRYDPSRPRDHLCPEDHRVWRGSKLDAYWVNVTIRNQLQSAVHCGLAWRFTGREEYACAAAGVLLRCAEHYRDRVLQKSPPRWMAQSLDEATYILDAVRVFELVFGSPALPAQAARRVKEDYLLPTARFIAGERRAIHNIDSWFNAAVLAIGAVTGDDSLIKFAVEGGRESRHGLRDQLREGVSADGFWREGSLGYHYYTLSSVVEALIAARRLGIDLSEEREKAKTMFLAPLTVADSRWVIPPTNDGQPISLVRFASNYEAGAGLFPEEPALAAFLSTSYSQSRGQRSGIHAIFYGPDTLPEGRAPALRSRAFESSGFGVLRTRTPHPPGGEVYLLLDFGPYGGHHDHPDKLAVSFHALNRVLAPDTGTAGYSLALNSSWYRQTLSHNTLVVDRVSQRPASGKLLSFRGEGPLQHVIASAGDAYPGTDWTRGVFLADEGHVVILDRIAVKKPERSESEHLFDWVWHGYGKLEVGELDLAPLTERGIFGETDGYEIPQELRAGKAAGPIAARWEIRPDTPTQPSDKKPRTSGSVHLWLYAEGDLEVFSASAPGNPARDRLPLIVARRRGREALFRAVLEAIPDGKERTIRRVEPSAAGLRIITGANDRDVALP